MTSSDSSLAVKKDWPLANPWSWLAAGLALAVWSWLWTLTFQGNASDNRVIVLAIGFMLTGVGVWLRFHDKHTSFMLGWPPVVPTLARLVMAGLFALIALAVTALLVMTVLQWNDMGWKPGAMTLIWLTVAPLSIGAARRAQNIKGESAPIDVAEETGLAFVSAALTCGVGAMTLYLGPDRVTDWDTLRLFLRVLVAVTLMAAALTLVSMKLRRLVLSLVVLLHFAGITSACLSPSPSPALVQQVWGRVFRPYLEFMYLNNAYHFYAPEPGPASHIWFRLIYTNAANEEFGWWYKIPQVDDKGRSLHVVGLEYQRFLAGTESASYFVPPPQMWFTNSKGQTEPNPMFFNRQQALPGRQGVIIGMEERKHLPVPLHPAIPDMQQLRIPDESSKRLLASYARFVARKFATRPEDPELTFKSVKIYRVVHILPVSQFLTSGLPPTDPELYHPYYVGEFDSEGQLLPDSKNDPYLYWLLPILRERGLDPNSLIKDYARRHAGDPNWIRPEGQTQWPEQAVPAAFEPQMLNPEAKKQ